MICPYCHQEIPEGRAKCPHCGHPIAQKPIKEEPKLGRGMKIFIATGASLLAVFAIYYSVVHFNDPEYTRTPAELEPDSSLVEKLAEPVDAVSVDTTAADSIEKQEKEEAKKVYNSIRNPHRDTEKAVVEENTENGSEGEAAGSDNGSSTAAPSSPAPSAPSPKVEAIGNE